jgi:hypothetical protein
VASFLLVELRILPLLGLFNRPLAAPTFFLDCRAPVLKHFLHSWTFRQSRRHLFDIQRPSSYPLANAYFPPFIDGWCVWCASFSPPPPEIFE